MVSHFQFATLGSYWQAVIQERLVCVEAGMIALIASQVLHTRFGNHRNIPRDQKLFGSACSFATSAPKSADRIPHPNASESGRLVLLLYYQLTKKSSIPKQASQGHISPHRTWLKAFHNQTKRPSPAQLSTITTALPSSTPTKTPATNPKQNMTQTLPRQRRSAPLTPNIAVPSYKQGVKPSRPRPRLITSARLRRLLAFPRMRPGPSGRMDNAHNTPRPSIRPTATPSRTPPRITSAARPSTSPFPSSLRSPTRPPEPPSTKQPLTPPSLCTDRTNPGTALASNFIYIYANPDAGAGYAPSRAEQNLPGRAKGSPPVGKWYVEGAKRMELEALLEMVGEGEGKGVERSWWCAGRMYPVAQQVGSREGFEGWRARVMMWGGRSWDEGLYIWRA